MFRNRKGMVKLVLAAAITLALGTAVTYAVERASGKCSTCKGKTDKPYYTDGRPCPRCHGTGQCPSCKGTGINNGQTCPYCYKP